MIVRESISFQRYKDPKEALGLGIYTEKDFNSLDELTDYLIEILPKILETPDIPKNIIKDPIYNFKHEYGIKILDYVKKYVKISSEVEQKNPYPMKELYWENLLHKKIEKMGYKDF